MTRRALVVVAVLVLAAVAGYSFFGEELILSSPSSDRTTDNPSSTEAPVRYGANMDTGEVVIRLSDLEGQYNFVSESKINRSNAPENVRPQLNQTGVLKQHKRLFETENRSLDTPIFIISSIAIYENQSAANGDLESSIQSINDGTVKTAEHGSETVHIVKYRDQQNNYQTIVYIQQSNTVYYILTTDSDEYKDATALKLLTEMMTDMATYE